MEVRKTLHYILAAMTLSTVVFLLKQRRSPIPLPSFLTCLLENPVTETFIGAPVLLKRLKLIPGMKILDAGCGPGRLTVPVAKAAGPNGQVVALDSQPAMLSKLQSKLDAESLTNVRTVRSDLDAGALGEGGFDRVLLVAVLGEVRDRAAALRELYAALKPGGILSVTEVFSTRTTAVPRPSAARSRLRASGSWRGSAASRPTRSTSRSPDRIRCSDGTTLATPPTMLVPPPAATQQDKIGSPRKHNLLHSHR